MAEWSAPFHRPHMPSAEFDRLKAEYIKKHGYTITIPGIQDIFHLGIEKPMTAAEEKNWRDKNYRAFTPERYEEIKHIKQRRKEVFLAMLSSPSPRILNSRSSIITAIDDAQDALSTLSAVGTLMYMAAGAGVRKLITGPLGWVMGANDALNFVNKAIAPEQRMLQRKKLTETATGKTLKTSRAKWDIRGRLKKVKEKTAKAERLARVNRNVEALKRGGWRSKIIEALQTSDNVYGLGISLGAVMNLPYDAISGAVRAYTGEEVHVKMPAVDVGFWGRAARKLARNWLAFEGIPREYRYIEHHSPAVEVTGTAGPESVVSRDLELGMRIALFLAQQVAHMTADEVDPLDMDLSISDIKLRAPEPINILTREVIEEAGDRIEDGIAWPATGEKWSNAKELIEESSKHITDNMNAYTKDNAHSITGWAVAKHATEAAFYSLENVAGTGGIQIEHNPSYRVINSLQWLNFVHEDNITDEQKRMFADYLQRCDNENYTPHAKEVVQYAREYCGFDFVQMKRGLVL